MAVEASPVIESVPFDLGHGISAAINEFSGALVVTADSPGIEWDSWSEVDRYSLGPGWTWGAPYFVGEPNTPRRVHLAGMGAFELDAADPTGLSGYPGEPGFTFIQQDVDLAPRADLPERRSSFHRAQWDTDVWDYFSERGDLIATYQANGDREDRVYDDRGRLTRIVHADGRSTTVSYAPGGVELRSPDGDVTTIGLAAIGGIGPMVSALDSEAGRTRFAFGSSGKYQEIPRYAAIDTAERSTRFSWYVLRPEAVSKIVQNGAPLFP